MKENFVDFREVKEAVTIQMLLDHYQVNWLRKEKDELVGRCPIHKGEGERTFHANLTKNNFQCFSCKARGNVLDLCAALEGCSIRDAALKLKDWFGVGKRGLPAQGTTRKQENQKSGLPDEPINPPLSFQLRLDPAHEYGLNRGLTKETIAYFGTGLCLSKGMFAGRYVIPLHNEAGQLVGYAGRSLEDSTPDKYLFPPRDKGFYKSHLLFNLHRVIKELPTRDCPVILVEGFFGCMWLRQCGYLAVGLLGSSLSEAQEELLCAHFNQVALLLDGDEAGRKAAADCVLRLGRKLWVKAFALADGVQPDMLSLEDIRRLLLEQ